MAQAFFSPAHSLGPAQYLVFCFLPLNLGAALPPSYLHHCGVLSPATVPGSLGLAFYLSRFWGVSLSLFLSLTAEKLSYHLALPVHELARPRRPRGARRHPELPGASQR